MIVGLVQQAYAQCTPGAGGIDLGSCLKLSNSQEIRNVYSNPAFLVNLIVRNVFILGGVAVIFLIIAAGFKFIQGGTKGVEEAKTIITTALLGAMIMFSAYWIVQFVKYITGADIVI